MNGPPDCSTTRQHSKMTDSLFGRHVHSGGTEPPSVRRKAAVARGVDEVFVKLLVETVKHLDDVGDDLGVGPGSTRCTAGGTPGSSAPS